MFFNITRYERGSQFPYVFEKDDLKLSRKRKVSSHYEEEETPVEFVSKVEEKYHHFFHQSVEIVVNYYFRSSMTQELLSFCLILATYKEKVDKIELVEVTNQFCFENEHRFFI